MSDDNKPFVCSQPGCGMQFTNEDHLAVHVRKHDMSLALNLTQGTLSPHGLFTDQTPTPTKFLRNCEELGLFQELSKNPFDDSFKKAMDEPIDHVSVENSLHLPETDADDLDTPQPPVQRVVIGGEELRDNRRHGDKPKDLTVSSIVPKKRKKFLSQSMPTSTTSEDEEEAVIGSSTELTGSSLNNDTNSVLVDVSSSEQVQSPKCLKVEMTSPTINETEPVFIAQPISTAECGTTLVINDGPKKSSAAVFSSSNITIASVPTQSQPAVTAAPVMVQVLLQLPGGQVVPVQVPASNIASSQPVVQKTPQQGVQLVSPVTPASQNFTQNSPALILAGNTLLQTAQNVQTVPPSGILQNFLPFTLKSSPKTSPQTGSQTVLNQSVTNANLQSVLNQSTTGNAQSAAQSALRTMLVANKQTGLQAVSPKQTGFQTVPSQNNVTQVIENTLKLNQNSNKTQKIAVPSSQSYAKQRLKAAIQQQLTPSSQKLFQALEIKSEPQWSPVSVGSSTTLSSPETVMPGNIAVSVDSFSGESESPDADVKRSKFLERNRAAAARCRQKRKQWVQTLERKAEDLSTINNQLCAEIKKLRGEVANLKTMLLAHKDCPVTMQMRAQGQIVTDILDSENGVSDITPLTVNEVSYDQTVSEEPSGSNHISTITTVDQSGSHSAFPVTFVPNVSNDKLVIKPVSVVTGSNSVGLIPKILNLNPNSLKTTSGS